MTDSRSSRERATGWMGDHDDFALAVPFLLAGVGALMVGVSTLNRGGGVVVLAGAAFLVWGTALWRARGGAAGRLARRAGGSPADLQESSESGGVDRS